MARPLRIEFPGAVYHITSRGNAKANIFLDGGDHKHFLEILTSVVNRFNWICHAYCLMNNHYHLLVETVEGNLSRGMRQLNGEYTQLFNRRHSRVGHVFQGRYKAILVEKMKGLLRGKEEMKEIPKRERYLTRPPLAELFGEAKVPDKKNRNTLIYNAHVKYGYSLHEIAQHLKIHYSTVSRAMTGAKSREENA